MSQLNVNTIGARTGSEVAIASGHNLDNISCQVFRLTADLTVTGSNTIATGWEVPDNVLNSNFGNNVTESAGVFSFTKTGFYKIELNMHGAGGTDSSAHHNMYIYTSNDGGSTYEASARAITQEGGGGGNAYTVAVVDITDLTNHKVTTEYYNTSGNIEGDTNQTKTSITFTRLGNT